MFGCRSSINIADPEEGGSFHLVLSPDVTRFSHALSDENRFQFFSKTLKVFQLWTTQRDENGGGPLKQFNILAIYTSELATF
jgi:hypothetical protein